MDLIAQYDSEAEDEVEHNEEKVASLPKEHSEDRREGQRRVSGCEGPPASTSAPKRRRTATTDTATTTMIARTTRGGSPVVVVQPASGQAITGLRWANKPSGHKHHHLLASSSMDGTLRLWRITPSDKMTSREDTVDTSTPPWHLHSSVCHLSISPCLQAN